MTHSPPASDEAILDMVRMRCRGISSYDIADAFDITAERVRVLTNRVKADDLKKSGEGKYEVLRGYW